MNNKNFELIKFSLTDSEESDRMIIQEYEQVTIESKRKTYINNSNDPISYIDEANKPDDMHAFEDVQNQCINDPKFYEKVLNYAKIENPDAYNILKDHSDIFYKRLGIFDHRPTPQT